MKITFIGQNTRDIGECNTPKEAWKLMKEQPEMKGSLYQRIIGGSNEDIMIDFGSHNEFFVITGTTFDEFNNNK